MRVTDTAMIRQFLAALRSNKESLSSALTSFSDGKEVRYASDDPSRARSAIEIRGRLVRSEGYRRSAETARFDLETVDHTMRQVYDLLTEARTKGMAGASSTMQDGQELLATEIEQIREQLINLANTEQSGRFLFGGTETLARPFDSAGVYTGDANEAQAALGPNHIVGVTVDGGRAFQGAGDIFATLTDMATAMRNDDSATMQTLLGDLNAEMDHLNQVRTEYGTRLELIDRTLSNIADEQVRLQGRIAEIENIDLDEVAVQLAAADTSFQALSAAGARVLGRSLFDYLG